MSKKIIVIVSILLIFVIFLIATLLIKKASDDNVNWLGTFDSPTPLKKFPRAAIATDAEHCASVGRLLLEKNGTAMDAAIGVLLCMNVVIPQSMGIAGGCFITFYNRTSRTATVIDAREVAPLAASENMYHGNASAAKHGPLAIAVPGELAGYSTAHKLFGRLPWNELFRGAINLAENGFTVGAHLEAAIKRWSETIPKFPALKERLFGNHGKPWKEGDIWRRPDMAGTLRKIAAGGAELFYNGSLMQTMVSELREMGSIITEQDFRTYRPKVYPALEIPLLDQNLTMYSVRPPGSGALLGFILNVMSGYKDMYPKSYKDIEDMYPKTDTLNEQSAALFYHRLIETFKFAYSKRMHMGDEDFDDVRHIVDTLINGEFAKRTREKIDDERTYSPEHYGTINAMNDDHGTAHVSVVDQFGNSVAVGSTVNLYFGSMVVSNSTGIIFNDQMDDFASPNITNFFGLPPARVNKIKPGKRPLSSMCPTVITDRNSGVARLVIGGAGGTKITSATAIVAIRNLFFKENIKDAIDAPRIHHQLYPNEIVYDESFPTGILTLLTRKGHQIKKLTGRNSVILGISKPAHSRNLEASFDYKKSGSLDGF